MSVIRLTRRGLVGIAVTSSLVAAASATAAVAPDFSMVWDASGDSVEAFTYNPGNFGEAVDNFDGSWTYTGGIVGESWEMSWICDANDNRSAGLGGGSGMAFVDAEIVVTNTSASVQTFSMLMSLNLSSSISAPITADGSAGYTLTNVAPFGDATIAAPDGSSLYKGFVDVVDPFADTAIGTLYDAPFSDTVAGAFATTSANDAFGTTDPGSADTNVAVLLTFELSPGDSASVVGTLIVVPGPGALALLAVGGFAGRRRRRG
ncbi:MAG: hypothetical protein AB8G96_05780 [Phycisphaerales bacterium]